MSRNNFVVEDIEEVVAKPRRKRTRRVKVGEGEVKPPVKDRLVPEHKIPLLTAKTGNQKKALKFMEEGRQVVILSGAAGTGKSMLAAFNASKALKSGLVEKIILIRPMVTAGSGIGLLPGTVKEKLSPALAPIISHLEKFLGIPFVKYAMDKSIIEMQPLEFIRGASFENTYIISEEVQNCTPNEIMALVTRIGEGSFLTLTGDRKQNDLRGKVTGVEYLSNIVEKYSNDTSLGIEESRELQNNVGVVEFTNDDVVRSGITKAFVKAFNKEGV